MRKGMRSSLHTTRMLLLHFGDDDSGRTFYDAHISISLLAGWQSCQWTDGDQSHRIRDDLLQTERGAPLMAILWSCRRSIGRRGLRGIIFVSRCCAMLDADVRCLARRLKVLHKIFSIYRPRVVTTCFIFISHSTGLYLSAFSPMICIIHTSFYILPN